MNFQVNVVCLYVYAFAWNVCARARQCTQVILNLIFVFVLFSLLPFVISRSGKRSIHLTRPRNEIVDMKNWNERKQFSVWKQSVDCCAYRLHFGRGKITVKLLRLKADTSFGHKFSRKIMTFEFAVRCSVYDFAHCRQLKRCDRKRTKSITKTTRQKHEQRKSKADISGAFVWREKTLKLILNLNRKK